MFRKPFKIKSNTQMKGCDKKKLKLELIRNFPTLTTENLKEILSTKDDISLVKILTHCGEFIHFYCVEKIPILFSRANKLYPTLYFLWKYPNALPFFTTVPEVVPVLQGGADFMVAGIVSENSNNRFGNVNKNDTVYINLIENKVAVAVGECVLSSHDMYMSGGRGKCMIVLHVVEDELCKFGGIVSLPQQAPSVKKSSNDEELTNIVPKKQTYASTVKQQENECLNEKLQAIKIADEVPEIESSPENDINDIVMYCFLKALNTSVKNVKLPLLISNFYKVHMIPACPKNRNIDIKKSRFKKMSKLIQEMAAEDVIRIEESSPGVLSIIHVNYSHHLLSGFVDDQPDTTIKDNKMDEPKVCEKYSVTATVLPLFSEFLIKKGESMTVSEARKYTAQYIRKHNLPLPENQSLVKLNDVLRNIVIQGSNSEIPEIVKWEEIMNRVLYKMSRTFKITTNNTTVFSQKEQKGKLPLIDIRIANKSKNKKVTLINNLEAYGINIEEFSRECQKGVAASATINQISALKSSQLQIQGNQINFIEKILTGKYNIPKKYINGLQFAPKKK